MSAEISKMTNKELIAYCSRNNIDVDSKNVSKPTKDELFKAIEAVGDTVSEELVEDEGLDEFDVNEGLDEFLDISDEVEKVISAPQRLSEKATREQRRRAVKAELTPLRRVIITENDKNQTTISTQVHYCTWGNRLIGHLTDRFVCGSPWHVREGALRNLRSMMAGKSIQDEEGNTIRHETINKYIIQELPPLTEDERAIIGKRQLIRDSSIESLI